MRQGLDGSRSELYSPERGHERETSNNVAEYAGLIAVLEWFINRELLDAEIIVRGDSMLVIYQMFGDWKIKKGFYTSLAYKARKLLARFTNIRGEWVRNDLNDVADGLSKAALKQAEVQLKLQPA